jgi:hypothetical protein
MYASYWSKKYIYPRNHILHIQEYCYRLEFCKYTFNLLLLLVLLGMGILVVVWTGYWVVELITLHTRIVKRKFALKAVIITRDV